MRRRDMISIARVVFLASVVSSALACLPRDEDECREGERRCEGNVARVCVRWEEPPCEEEESGCWPSRSGRTAGYKWRTEDCGSRMCVADGVCATVRERDPKCASVDRYCSGLVAVTCMNGFAVEEDNGDLALVPDGLEAQGTGEYVVRVGERIRFHLERDSTCGHADVTSAESVSSEAPDVLAIEDGAVVGRSVGRSTVFSANGREIAARFEVLAGLGDP
jgi:hypothetical protein